MQRGWSQGELATKAGISVSYLSMLENSKRDPTVSTVKKVAQALGVPMEILFFLGAEDGELAGIDKALAGQLALTALGLLNEKIPG